MILLFVVFLISLGCTYFLIHYSHKKSIFIDCHESDKPQRFHDEPTPRVGGVGIFIASTMMMFVSMNASYIVIAGSIAFLSGILEDFSSRLSARKRLIMHVLASLLFVGLLGSAIKTVGFGINFPVWLAILFTTFAIVGVINAVNIIDGFNGLASGFALIVFIIYGLVSYNLGDTEMTMVCLIMSFSILGFLIWNFPYGKIFLGDGGAYFLGFMVGAVSVLIVNRHPQVSAWFCLLVCIYPVWEVLFSFYRKKLVRGMSPLKPDKSHLHMLIYKRITKSNPKTSMLILTMFIPYQLIAMFIIGDKLLLISLIVLFVVHYFLVYEILVKFKRK